ncbi:UNVERIFIED_CONTAM: hypothetical protein FKN15_010246, partial [Acipenser sinensis]
SDFARETAQSPAYDPGSQPSVATAAPSSFSPPSSSASASAFCPVVPVRGAVVERQPRMLNFCVEYRSTNVDVVLEESSSVGKKKHIRPHEHPCPTSAMGRLACHCQRRLDLAQYDCRGPDPSYPLSGSEFTMLKGHAVPVDPILKHIVTVMTLAVAGISFPCHRLTVCRRTSPAHTQEQTEECTDVHMVSDSEGDDFEDASEFGVDEGEIFGMGTSASRKSPMMPENAENEGDALLHFTAEFSSRYGECHPVFFIGSLEAAFQETFYGKARDRKPLAIYLHHDDSVLTNVFCSQMLCAESIVSYLSQNFITWAWDMTKEANRARLLTMCTRHFGSVVAQTIRTYKTDQFPLLLIIMGKRSSNEVLNVIQGNTTVDELMMRLMAAMEIFTAQQQEDIRDEDEREARELVKREQDEAYRVSLEADRAKDEREARELVKREQDEAYRVSLEADRAKVTQLDPTWSLVEAKLFPQETLFLEAKE